MSAPVLLTYDYLCPFARNANEHAVAAMAVDDELHIEFTPYSLAAGAIGEGDTPVWQQPDPSATSGILALQAGLAVRDTDPDHFLAVHLALFAARHDQGRDLKDPGVVADAVASGGADADAVMAEVATGRFLKLLEVEHERNAHDRGVWGVPTFVGVQRAVFVRLMDRPDGDGQLARRRIGEVVDLVQGSPHLHEFKQVDLPV